MRDFFDLLRSVHSRVYIYFNAVILLLKPVMCLYVNYIF